MRVVTFLAAVGWIAAAAAGAAPVRESIRLAGAPSVAPDGLNFCFEWKGDLWVAPVAGGGARPIAAHPAGDTQPEYSPDGREIAFASERDDTWQLYVVPAEGGLPQQLTWHTEGFTPIGWFPDGTSVLARATRDARGLEHARLYQVRRDARKAERMLFDDYATDGAVSPDGKSLLFTREGEDVYRMGYRGSNASQVWLYDFATRGFRLVCGGEFDCRSPMWRPDGQAFYYTDARSGCANLWEHDLANGTERALTAFTNSPVLLPALARGGSVIVFRQLFDFYRMNPASNAAPERIELYGELDIPNRQQESRRWYKNAWNNDSFGTVDFTKDGLEMVFTAGGDVWAMDTVLREPRQITSGTLAHDTEAVFAPDAGSVYFLRDTGERVGIWRATRRAPGRYWWQAASARGGAAGKTEAAPGDDFVLEQLTDDAQAREKLSFSPDGTRLACVQGRGDIVLCDAKGGNPRIVASSPSAASYAWSPDGRWLVCALTDSGENSDIWIVSSDGEQKYNLSRNPGWDGEAAWSPDGRLIAFVGRTYDLETDLYYVWLSREDEELDKRERSIERAIKTMDDARADKKDGKSGALSAKPKPILRIDFDRLSDRVRRLPLPGATPSNLFWSYDSKALAFAATVGGRKGTYKLGFPDPGTPEFMTANIGQCAKWVEKGSKVLWLVEGVPASFQDKYPFEAYQSIDWPEYQRLGFRQAWRMLRDGFYDARLNNRDWDAVRLKYEDMAAAAPDLATFRRVVMLMSGELNASHLGFTAEAKKAWSSGEWKIRTAHLGLRFDPAHPGPGVKVAEVLAGGPTDTVRTRLKPGELVLRMDGVEVAPDTDLSAVLNGKWPRDLTLDVRGTDGRERQVEVSTISYEEARALLRKEWIEQNRTIVDNLSSNRLGYLHIERMNWPSLRQFEKEIFAEGVGKDGLVVDVRNNPGGFISDHLLAILCHPQHAITVPRGGEESYPAGYLNKVVYNLPIVVLCNQKSTSNAEIFSHAIKTLGRGRVVGVATQGAVISTPERKILDLGTMRIPTRGWYTIGDGEDMELHGVTPDVVLWPRPGEIPAGKDVQLEKAVQVLVEEVAARRIRPKPALVPASQRKAVGERKEISSAAAADPPP